jgi:hypothetical protein
VTGEFTGRLSADLPSLNTLFFGVANMPHRRKSMISAEHLPLGSGQILLPFGRWRFGPETESRQAEKRPIRCEFLGISAKRLPRGLVLATRRA